MPQSVKPIPDGYHTVTPNLVVPDAGQALEFYQKAFNAQQTFRMDGPNGRVVHAEMKIGNSILMLCEENPSTGCLSPASLKGSSLGLYLYVEDADAVFNRAVRAGASVLMPLADMFWGDRMGQVSDPFGHRWSLATHKEDATPAQIEQRAQEFFSGLPKSG